MKAIRIPDEHSPYFEAAWQTYVASFPSNERRERAGQAALLANPEYRLDAWLDNGRFVGLMAWWDFGDYRYVEHVAVHPDCRSGGYGGKILSTWMAAGERPVYLEIEVPVDEATQRRRGFYMRLGFVDSGLRHLQPPYDGQGEDVPMSVLSWPGPITPETHAAFLHTLHSKVWRDVKE